MACVKALGYGECDDVEVWEADVDSVGKEGREEVKAVYKWTLVRGKHLF